MAALEIFFILLWAAGIAVVVFSAINAAVAIGMLLWSMRGEFPGESKKLPRKLAVRAFKIFMIGFLLIVSSYVGEYIVHQSRAIVSHDIVHSK